MKYRVQDGREEILNKKNDYNINDIYKREVLKFIKENNE